MRFFGNATLTPAAAVTHPTEKKKKQKQQQQLPLVTNCAQSRTETIWAALRWRFLPLQQPQQLLEWHGEGRHKKTSKFAVNVWLLFTPQSAINQRSVTDQTSSLCGANVQSHLSASMENLSEKVAQNTRTECCPVCSHGSHFLQERKNKTLYVASWSLSIYFFYSTETVSGEILMAEILFLLLGLGFHAMTLSGVGGHPIGTGTSQLLPRGNWRTSWRSGFLRPFIYPCWLGMLGLRQHILVIPSTVFWWMVRSGRVTADNPNHCTSLEHNTHGLCLNSQHACLQQTIFHRELPFTGKRNMPHLQPKPNISVFVFINTLSPKGSRGPFF